MGVLWSLRILLLVLLVPTAQAGAAQAAESAQATKPRDLSPLLRQVTQEQRLPAAAALVIEGGEIAAQGVAGVRRAGRPEQAGLDDRWHLGSNTKAMTATPRGHP